jgi:hypothetical protein
MSSNNPLEPAWTAYLVTRDCLRIARRALSRRERALFSKTALLSPQKAGAESLIEESRIKSDEFVIVALWAEFERFLIAYLQDKSKAVARQRPKKLSFALQGHLEEQIERWQIDDILNLFKTVIDPTRIGQAKQVKQFRDWVAHKNPRKGEPAKIDPQTAYVLLSGIIAEIQKAGA